jgi:serine/threonine protein phosphatase PrpC
MAPQRQWKKKFIKMGVYLSQPDTRKTSLDGEGNGVKYGASSMQGWRLNMEDAEISEAKFGPHSSLFAVFDGHGGSEVAKFCGKYFAGELKKNPKFANETDIEAALVETFLKMDEIMLTPEGQSELKRDAENPGAESQAGCTANVTLIHKKMIYCANAGDSRTICYANGKCIPLSIDHKPDNPEELARIEASGGFVTGGRVNGNLNLSRALGDFEMKKSVGRGPAQQAISSVPDIMKRQLTKAEEFLVMGCDGIWELLTPDEICQITKQEIGRKGRISEIAELILDRGLAPTTENGTGCDNMSAIVIQLNC